MTDNHIDIDTDYIFAPYIPPKSVPVVLDPEPFVPKTGILTRYGKRILEEGASFYSTVRVVDLVMNPVVRKEKKEKVNWKEEGF